MRAGPGGEDWEPAIATTSSEGRDFHRADQAVLKIKIWADTSFASLYRGVRQSMVKATVEMAWRIAFPSGGYDMKIEDCIQPGRISELIYTIRSLLSSWYSETNIKP